MTTTTHSVSLPALAAALLIAGCDAPSGDNAPTSGPSAGSMPQQTLAAPHTAQGTVNSIDRAAGRVNISHGPVASANWPAMTMGFKLRDASAASGLETGQRVEFKFTIESGMDATVTEIRAIE